MTTGRINQGAASSQRRSINRTNVPNNMQIRPSRWTTKLTLGRTQCSFARHVFRMCPCRRVESNMTGQSRRTRALLKWRRSLVFPRGLATSVIVNVIFTLFTLSFCQSDKRLEPNIASGGRPTATCARDYKGRLSSGAVFEVRSRSRLRIDARNQDPVAPFDGFVNAQHAQPYGCRCRAFATHQAIRRQRRNSSLARENNT